MAKDFRNEVIGPGTFIWNPEHPGGPIAFLGWTRGDAIIRTEKEIVRIEAPNQSTGSDQFHKTDERVYVTGTFSEMTLDNLRLFFDTPEGIGSHGAIDELCVGGSDQLTEGILKVCAMAPDGKKRVFQFHKAHITGDSKEYIMNRTEKTTLTITWECKLDRSRSEGRQYFCVNDDKSKDYTLTQCLETS